MEEAWKYGRIWGNMGGGLRSKVSGGDSEKPMGNYGKNGSGRAPSEKVIKPPGEGTLPTGPFLPLAAL